MQCLRLRQRDASSSKLLLQIPQPNKQEMTRVALKTVLPRDKHSPWMWGHKFHSASQEHHYGGYQKTSLFFLAKDLATMKIMTKNLRYSISSMNWIWLLFAHIQRDNADLKDRSSYLNF